MNRNIIDKNIIDKKKISIVIPCFNEEENVVPISKEVCRILEAELSGYEYEIIFIDNNSGDNTRYLLRKLCRDNKNIKAIFNAKNFGQFNSPYYGMLQTRGDCAVLLCCDFQDPVELIPVMVHEWEEGAKIVVMQKRQSEENRILYFLRTCYYKAIHKFSDVEQIEHFTGFGLYDQSFIHILRELKDPTPFLRGIVAELGYDIQIIPYTQRKRRGGKTSNNFSSLYDAAMLSVTSYTKIGLRIATFMGFATAVFSVIIALIYLILKLAYWERFLAGTAPILIGMFFLGAVVMIFLGIMGEYILSMNQRIMNRPLVIESERINFSEEDTDGENEALEKYKGGGNMQDG